MRGLGRLNGTSLRGCRKSEVLSLRIVCFLLTVECGTEMIGLPRCVRRVVRFAIV